MAGHSSLGTLEYYTDYGTPPDSIGFYTNSKYVDSNGVVLEPTLPDMPAPEGYVFGGWFDANGMQVIANVTYARDIATIGYIDPNEPMFGSIYALYAKFFRVLYIKDEILKDIADAVRNMQGTTEKYSLEELISLIDVPYEEEHTSSVTRTVYIGKEEDN